jgi:hypothetical protein
MITTIKVERSAADWLNTLKGYLEYISDEKLTLNDAFISILAEIDWLYLHKKNITNNEETEIKKRIISRLDRYWGKDNKNKLSILITDTGNVVIKEKEKWRQKKL